jgi:serine/threonine protein kinase
MSDFTGQTFDRYLLLEPAGQGGMASVYKAYDTRLERDVAVKIIRTDMFIPATLQHVLKRFEREAKSLAKLSHPNIVSIIDYGEHDSVPYLVMEYLPGGTLKNRLVSQHLRWQESFRLLLPIARALQFAHQQGIIHRDVKPSNILITLSGEPMLSDFGIAKIMETEGSTGLTGTGVGIGTPEYMAPEQWVGRTSPQSDLYSLGVVLYEMITGSKPYSADTPAAILLKQANDPLPRPRQFVMDLPVSVEKIILKTLAKKPENRYQNMEEFIIALENLLGGQARIKQPVVPAEMRKVEKSSPIQTDPLSGQIPLVDQPTLITRISPQEKPVELALPAVDAGKTRIASPETPSLPLDMPHKVRIDSVVKNKVARLYALLRGRNKTYPAWTFALLGLLALVVIAFAVIGIRRLAARSASAPVSTGYIYYTSDQSGKAEIYYLDSKAIAHQVTQTSGDYRSWSPVPATNGYIFYTSDQSGKAEIYYLDAKAISHQVTQTPGDYQSWSPFPAAGGLVYYTSDQSGKAEIYYLDSKAISHQVTQTPGGYQSWSPVPAVNGYIYYTSDQSGKPEVYYLDSKATSHQVTQTPGGHQSWSPFPAAGGLVYYTSDQSGKAEIYYLDAKAISHQVTQTPGLMYQSWSPFPLAGGVVYYTSDQRGRIEIYYLDARATSHRVTQTSGGYRSWMFMYGKTSDITQP